MAKKSMPNNLSSPGNTEDDAISDHKIMVNDIVNSIGVAIGNGATVNVTVQSYHSCIPFQAPSLPAWFVFRPDICDPLLAEILNTNAPGGALLISAIHGLGGIGKTTVAAFLAQHQAIAERFPDGVLWVTLGQKPDVLSLMHTWIQALGGQFNPLSIESAELHLRTLLKNKACLLVIDDAWKAEYAHPFLNGGEKCRVIVTTRDASLARKLGAKLYNLDILSEAQSLALLTARLGTITPADLPVVAVLVRELGYHPLILELAAARFEDGQSWTHLLSYYQDKIAYLDMLDLDESNRSSEFLSLCIQASLDTLSQAEQEAFAWLGVLVDDARINPRIAAVLWKTSIEQAAEQLERWCEKMLLKPLGTGEYSLHDLLHDEARLHLTVNQTWQQAQSVFLGRLKARTQNGLWHTLPDDGYSHQHLAWHLVEAMQVNGLYTLLCEETPEGQNAWFIVQDRLGLFTNFLADVRLAWEHASYSHDVKLQIRYALIITSLKSLAANLQPELVAALVQSKFWSSETTLTHVQQIPDSENRAKALVAIAHHLSHEQQNVVHAEALTATRSIKDEYGRSNTLRFIVPYLPPELLATALSIARSIKSEYDRSNALVSIVSHLPPELLAEALSIARGIEDEYRRSLTLVDIAPHLSPEQQGAALAEALTAVHSIKDKRDHSRALKSIAPHLPPIKAFDIVRGIEDKYYHSVALASIALHLPRKQHGAAFTEALSIARSIDSEMDRSSALTSIASHLPPELFPTALSIARSIKSEYVRSDALVSIVSHLPPELFPTALSIARSIKDKCYRSRALSAIAFRVPPEQQGAMLIEALASARSIKDEYHRSQALSAIAPHLPPKQQRAMLIEALASAHRIDSEYNRSNALVNFISHTPPNLLTSVLAETLNAVRDIKYEHFRSRALVAIIPHLSSDLLSVILTEALNTARSISDEYYRSRALNTIALYLSPNQRSTALNAALEVAHNIRYAGNRSQALATIASHLSFEQQAVTLDEAVDAACSIEDERTRSLILAAIAPQLSSELLAVALDAAQCIKDGHDCSYALDGIVPCLPPELLNKALSIARGIEDKHSRSLALTTIAHRLPPEQQGAVLNEALKAAHSDTSQYSHDRFETLNGVIRCLPPTKALNAAREIKDTDYRSQILAAIAPRLAPIEAIDVARGIEDAYYRSSALTAIASRLLPKQQSDVFAIALIAAQGIKNEYSRSQSLSAIAPHLPPTDALNVVRNIKNEPYRSNALAAIAPYLPSELLASALDTARSIVWEYGRIKALIAIALCLPPEQLSSTLDEALNIAYSIKDNEMCSSALSVVAPHLLPEQQIVALKTALHAACSIENEKPSGESMLHDRANEDGYHRFKAISMLSPLLAKLPMSAMYFQENLLILAVKTRGDLLSDLEALAPWLASFGEDVVYETVHAIQDVGRWWP